MKITGRLKVKHDTKKVSEKFRVREFVITDESKSKPQHLKVRAVQENCELLDEINIGEEMQAEIKILGTEWKTPEGEVKHFNTLQATSLTLMK